MSIAAQIYLALKLDKAPLIRRLAASIVARNAMEFNLYGVYPEKAPYQRHLKLCQRFRLFDLNCALSAHYPPKFL